MNSDWSKSWRGSVQPRKQRKYVYNLPLHLAGSLLRAPLSKDLRKKYGCRSVTVRSGDKVKILRGQHKGTVGVISTVSRVRRRIHIEGVGVKKRDGRVAHYPFFASNLQVLELQLDDAKRRAKLTGAAPAKPATKKTTTKKPAANKPKGAAA